MTQRIPENLIDDIRRRADLVDLAGRLGVRLREKSPGDFWGCCPFHSEKTASFHILRRRGIYKCFGCGAGGDAVRFWKELNGLGFGDAVRDLASMTGVDVDDPLTPSSRSPLGPRSADPLPPGEENTSRRPVIADQLDHGPDPAEQHRKVEKARTNYWLKTKPLAGTVAETYLLEARAIRARFVEGVSALRFLADCPYWARPGDGERFEIIHSGPALAAGMQTPDGRFSAVHLTYLERDGSDKLRLWKRPPNRLTGDVGEPFPAKKIQGLAGAAAVRLCDPAPDMAVAEGIETALSSPSCGGPPAWAAGSLNNMAGPGIEGGYQKPYPSDRRRKLPTEFPDLSRPAFAFPAGCERATVIGDGDTKDQFVLAALLKRAVRRFRMQGIDAGYVITPPGTDLNDLWREDAARVMEG